MLSMLNVYLICLQMKLKDFFTDEEGDVNVVSIVVLIGVAVLLAVVFKDAIGKLITDLIGTITGNATGAVNQPPQT